MKKIFFFFNLIFIYNYSFSQKQGQQVIDSLVVQLLSAKEDTGKVSLLTDLAYEYHKSNPDTGLEYANKALKLANALNWKAGSAAAYNRIGLCYWAKANYPRALGFHFESIALYEKIKNKKGIATVLGNIGLVYYGENHYSKALEYHLKALKLNEELQDKSAIARNLGNIGISYDAMSDYSHSLEYYFRALKIYESLGDKNGVARNLGNIGFVYNELRDHPKALEYHYKALSMNEELGNKILMSLNIGNIGEEYYNIARDTSASWIKTRPDSLSTKTALRKGEEYLVKAITLFTEIEDLNSLQELYKYLSDLHLLSDNYKESLESYKKYTAAKDSLFNLNNRNRIATLEKNREDDLKQKEIELLKSQNEIEQLTAQRRKGIIYGLSGALVCLCFITIAFFRQGKKQARLNVDLQKAYTDLKETQEELLKQQRLAALGTFASNIAHEIQNPLNFVNNFSVTSSELLTEFTESANENERQEIVKTLKENLEKINHHGNRADAIVKKVFQHLLEGKGHELFDEDAKKS